MKLLTVMEAVEWLRLDADYPTPGQARDALLRHVRAGRLRPLAHFKQYRFTDAELERFAAALTEEFTPGRNGRSDGQSDTEGP